MTGILGTLLGRVNESLYFPVILKGGNKILVVYKDHSEWYELKSTFRGDAHGPYDPYGEADMAKQNGFKMIRDKE